MPNRRNDEGPKLSVVDGHAPQQTSEDIEPWEPLVFPERTGAGRPSALTDLVAFKIVTSIRRGNSRLGAAARAGIGYATLKRWLAWGREGVKPFDEFERRFEDALAQCEEESAYRVRGGEPGWQGAAWWLERHGWARNRWKRPVERVENNVLGQLSELLGNDARAEEWLLARLEEVKARKAESEKAETTDAGTSVAETERARTSERVQ